MRAGLMEWLWSAWTAGGLGWLAGVVVSLGRAALGVVRLPRLAEPHQSPPPAHAPARRARSLRSARHPRHAWPRARGPQPACPAGRAAEPAGAAELPLVSVVVAARNEAHAVRVGVGSILASDYPRLEVIAIDDRSSDGTDRALEQLASLAALRDGAGQNLPGLGRDGHPAPPGAPGPALAAVAAAAAPPRALLSGSPLAAAGSPAAPPPPPGPLAEADPGLRLRILRIRSLPAGWLGKNHALQRGAELARGEWLLFTDADVHFAPGAIRAAVTLAERQGLDHLTVLPVLRLRGMPLRLFLVWVLLVFTVWTRPWNACRPDRRCSAGVGAFNLVRRGVYQAVGGHAAIPLALADDVALGARVKAAGFRQALALASRAEPGAARRSRVAPLLEVQWYPSLRAAIRGLEKNAFALFRFRTPLVAAWTVAGCAWAWLPLLAVLVAPGWHRLPWIAAYLLTATVFWYAGLATAGEFPWAWGLLFPVGQTLLVWTVARSTGLALRYGGVRWRDTFYPLSELRAADRGRA